MTPPFRYNSFLMKAMTLKEITFQDIYNSNIPNVLLMVLCLDVYRYFLKLLYVCLISIKDIYNSKFY